MVVSRLPGVSVAVDEGWEAGFLHEDGWGVGHLTHPPGLSWVGLAEVSVVTARGTRATRRHLPLSRGGTRLTVSGCTNVVHCKEIQPDVVVITNLVSI